VSRLHRDERGVALVLTISVSAALALLVTSLLGYGLSTLRQSRDSQDRLAALAAAEAGVDDYLSRLNRDENYWQYNASNPPPPSTPNPALTGFTPVPGDANEGAFTYVPDASTVATDGVVVLTSTGRVRSQERTVRVLLRSATVLDYLYYTEYETTDPSAYTRWQTSSNPVTYVYGATAQAQADAWCHKHRYDVWTNPNGAVQTGRDSRCADISWFGDGNSRDVVEGPFHTNDIIVVNGDPHFLGTASTAWAGGYTESRRWYDGELSNQYNSALSTPYFALSPRTDDMVYAPPVTMPPSNTAIKAQAAIGGPGCLYTGPTRVILKSTGGRNGRGSMDVTSPFTRSTSPGCVGRGVPLPANGVLYVQNVPTTAGDPNTPRTACTSSTNHPLGYPVPNDRTTYNPCAGDVFIEGTLRSRLTVAAEKKVIITWHLDYASGTGANSTDLLGLVSNDFIEVYHPIACRYYNATTGDCWGATNLAVKGSSPFTNPRINAALVSVQHSFRVQNHRYGRALGTLNVNGAIAQVFRGPVGTFGGVGVASGYDKNYLYDNRLQYLGPPHFIEPVESYWRTTQYAEEVG